MAPLVQKPSKPSRVPLLRFVVVVVLLVATDMSSRLCCLALSSSSTQLLKGKRILVTGGGRGIGRAIALICHEEGADVVITSRTQSELEETIRLANNNANNNNSNSGADEMDKQQKRLKQSAMAAALLSRRGGRSSGAASLGKSTSVGIRRTGTATKARMGRSSVSQLVDAVKTGSSSMANNNNNNDDSASCNNNRMTYRVCDITVESQVDAMVRELVGNNNKEDEGASSIISSSIDILINNAGGAQSPKGMVGTLDNQDLETLLKLNVIGPQLITSAMCKYSPGWIISEATEEGKTAAAAEAAVAGSEKVVLNISSKAGKVGLPNYSFYVATKFALEGLTSSWAKELASRNIRVHSMSPGMVNTQSFPKPDGKPGVREASSIKDCLLLALTGSIASENENENENDEHQSTVVVTENMMDYTGHYIHVDEYDKVVDQKGIEKAHLAWKAIDEDPFEVV